MSIARSLETLSYWAMVIQASLLLRATVVVPAVEGVESPEAVNYRFMFANGKLYISNYDGTVLAFAQAGGGGGDDGAGEDPAAPAEEDITE